MHRGALIRSRLVREIVTLEGSYQVHTLKARSSRTRSEKTPQPSQQADLGANAPVTVDGSPSSMMECFEITALLSALVPRSATFS